MIGVKNHKQPTHNLTLIFDNKEDRDYIEKLSQVSKLFQDFKTQMNACINSELLIGQKNSYNFLTRLYRFLPKKTYREKIAHNGVEESQKQRTEVDILNSWYSFTSGPNKTQDKIYDKNYVDNRMNEEKVDRNLLVEQTKEK